jgi:DNA-binding PadR family transcriptional regulator
MGIAGRDRRKRTNLGLAVLGLVASRPEGSHGYELKRECEALSEEFWELNYGSLYRALDALARDGALDVDELVQADRPNRKVYRITEQGRATLEEWLLAPIGEDVRPLRDELSLRLLFLEPQHEEALVELVRQQRATYLKRLADLAERRRRLEASGLDMEVTELVLDQPEMRIRVDMEWLEHVERQVLRGALGQGPLVRKQSSAGEEAAESECVRDGGADFDENLDPDPEDAT